MRHDDMRHYDMRNCDMGHYDMSHNVEERRFSAALAGQTLGFSLCGNSRRHDTSQDDHRG